MSSSANAVATKDSFEASLPLLVGQAVFYFDPVRAWELGTLLSFKRDPRSGLVGTFKRKADGEQVERVLKADSIYNHTPGTERNNPDNLLALSELHHSLLINVLKLRHADDNIYTYLGDLVIAINPFKYTIPYYHDAMMGEYSNYMHQSEIPFSAGTQGGPYPQFLRPHAWAVAHRAYVEMLQTNKKNHSVVISGESGAGKTETCKLLLKYLVHISGRKLREEYAMSNPAAAAASPSPLQSESGGSPLLGIAGGSAPYASPSFRGMPLSGDMTMPFHDLNSNNSYSFGGGSPSFAFSSTMNVVLTRELVEQREEHAAIINKRVQQANPILEAFGNAKTARNDNSSRFGKFMEVQFDDLGSLLGMRVTPFLLEKSRVIHCGKDERSYHCFYQLLAGASPSLLGALRLKRARDYPNLDRGNCLIIRGVDDAKEFALLVQAMNDVGITEAEQAMTWRVLGAVLHLQTIEFQEHRVTSAAELGLDGRNTCEFVARELLGLQQPAVLGECLVTTSTYIKQERIAKALSVKKAKDQRDSLCRYLYSKLFYWLVQRINEATMGSSSAVTSWIGLLDIFGFEDMAVNSFEQLCINLTNEVLQRNYTRAIFDRDLEDMRSEGIGVEAVKYKDNAQCIELLQGPKNSILSFLDDASTLDIERAQTDPNLTFLHRVTQQHRPDYQTQAPKGTKSVLDRAEEGRPLTASDYFLRGKLDDDAFTIRHYAGDVKYKVEGFVEKNIDTLKESTQVALLTTMDETVKNVLTTEEDSVGLLATGGGGGTSSPNDGRGVGKKTAAATFRKSLSLLRDLLGMSVTHWVRCLRPHAMRQPGLFDGKCMLEQLIATGVLETVAQRQRNFPFRLRHEEFLDRFGVIAFSALRKRRVRMAANDKCNTVIVTAQVGGEKEAQVGTSKVFLAGTARQALEAKRVAVLDSFVTTLQRYSQHYLSKEIACFLLTRRYAIIVQRRHRLKRMLRKAVRDYYEAIWRRMEEEMAAARRDLYVKETKNRTLVEAAMGRRHEELYGTFRRQLAPLVAAVLVNIQLVESQRRIAVENSSRDDWRDFEQLHTVERVAAGVKEQQRLAREAEERHSARQYLLDAFLEGYGFIKEDESTQRGVLTQHIGPLLAKVNADAASVAAQMRQRDAMLAVLEKEREVEVRRLAKAREERLEAEEALWKQHIGRDAYQKDLAFMATTLGLSAAQCHEHMNSFYANRGATAVVTGSVLRGGAFDSHGEGRASDPKASVRHRHGLGNVSSYRDYAAFMKAAYDHHATLNGGNERRGGGGVLGRRGGGHGMPSSPPSASLSPAPLGLGQLSSPLHNSQRYYEEQPLPVDFDEAVMSSRPLEVVVRERLSREASYALECQQAMARDEEEDRRLAMAQGMRRRDGGGGVLPTEPLRYRDVGQLMLNEEGGADAFMSSSHHINSKREAVGRHDDCYYHGQRPLPHAGVNVDALCGAWDSERRLQDLRAHTNTHHRNSSIATPHRRGGAPSPSPLAPPPPPSMHTCMPSPANPYSTHRFDDGYADGRSAAHARARLGGSFGLFGGTPLRSPGGGGGGMSHLPEGAFRSLRSAEVTSATGVGTSRLSTQSPLHGAAADSRNGYAVYRNTSPLPDKQCSSANMATTQTTLGFTSRRAPVPDDDDFDETVF